MANYIFTEDPISAKKPDMDYEKEYNAAATWSETYLFSYEDMVDNNELHLRGKQLDVGEYVYRGWMMKPDQYHEFYNQLEIAGGHLVNAPDEYDYMHMLPNWIRDFEDDTSDSVWTSDLSDDGINMLLTHFDAGTSVIVKDYVKSRKHEWDEAFFIPDVSDVEHALDVIQTFIERQGADIVGGIVLREYAELRSIGTHPVSGMPIAEEYRVFYWRGRVVTVIDYWKNNNVNLPVDILDYIVAVGQRVTNSNFYTIDFAIKSDGTPMIMEMGDGQVSGLQEYDEIMFYQLLQAQIDNE
jgi:hypothetical protein